MDNRSGGEAPAPSTGRAHTDSSRIEACSELFGLEHSSPRVDELSAQVPGFLQRVATLWAIDVDGVEMSMSFHEAARGWD